jgi:2-hydroxyethylphosphonate dioxygenase
MRPIKRDGIHFYNYYTLPSPKGYVAPVLIDILCPKNKLPKLNNGQVESAITLSLGPNDIYARFGKKINKTNWCKFKVNKDPKTKWIVGDNYFEPSYCLHTYSRATDGPGRILSYTTTSHVESLFSKKLNDNSFDNFIKLSKQKNFKRSILKQTLEDKGFELSYLAKNTKISLKSLKNFFNNSSNLTKKQFNKLCLFTDLDPRLFIELKHKEDGVGKLYNTYKDSLKTIRKFKSYTIASIVSSTRFQDLHGYYIKVRKKLIKKLKLDLLDSVCSHYLVTGGELNFYYKVKDEIIKKSCSEGDALWVGSFTEHAFYGNGSLAKISDGQNLNYLEKFDVGNLYNIPFTLKRARKDKINWGYDN